MADMVHIVEDDELPTGTPFVFVQQQGETHLFMSDVMTAASTRDMLQAYRTILARRISLIPTQKGARLHAV